MKIPRNGVKVWGYDKLVTKERVILDSGSEPKINGKNYTAFDVSRAKELLRKEKELCKAYKEIDELKYKLMCLQ